MDMKLESIEKVVQEKVKDVRHEMNKKITTNTEEMNKVKSQHEPLQTYGNIKTSWQTCLEVHEAVTNVNRWIDSEKATALTVCLRGEGLEVLQTLSEDKHKDYEDLVQRLEMRFGDNHLQQVNQAQPRGRMQRSNETLQQYEADIARLVYLAYPSAPAEFNEQLAAQGFIDGVPKKNLDGNQKLNKDYGGR